MTTNFFGQLQALQVAGDWKIAIKQDEAGKLIVSILLANDKTGDEAHKMIPPMILKGTALEIDEGFFNAIAEPAKKTASLFANMEHYMKQMEEVRSKSKMEQDKEGTEKKEKEERKKKYAAMMKKVDDLDEKKQYHAAMGIMPKADQFPEQAEEIAKHMEELRGKTRQLSLM
jgi:PRTRC genetic system protein E